MATRKAEPEERETYKMDVGASDLARPRMRIVTPLGEYQKMRPKMFETGDIVIGNAADDPDAEPVHNVGDGGGVLVHPLTFTKHLTADKDDDGKKMDFTRYEVGDPAAPRAAKKVTEFVFLCPEFDTVLPVMAAFTPGSRAASAAICGAIYRAQLAGKDARTLAFRLTTATKTGGGNTWDAYVATAVEPEPQHQLMAAEMGDQLIAPAARQITSGEPAEAAAF